MSQDIENQLKENHKQLVQLPNIKLKLDDIESQLEKIKKETTNNLETNEKCNINLEINNNQLIELNKFKLPGILGLCLALASCILSAYHIFIAKKNN